MKINAKIDFTYCGRNCTLYIKSLNENLVEATLENCYKCPKKMKVKALWFDTYRMDLFIWTLMKLITEKYSPDSIFFDSAKRDVNKRNYVFDDLSWND